MPCAECNGNGECSPSGCVCHLFWEGNDCSISWSENSAWYNLVLFKAVFTVVAQFVLALLCSIYLISIFRRKRVTKKVNSTFVVVAIIVASILRIIGYAPYMNYVNGKFSKTAERILFLIPILIWVNAAAMIILYWIEILTSKSAELLTNVRKLRPFLFAIMIVTTIGLLPVGVVAQVMSDVRLYQILDITWRVFLALALLFVVCSSSLFGFKLLRTVGKLYQSTKDSIFKEYIRKVLFSHVQSEFLKMTIELLFADLFVSLSLACTLLYTVTNADHNKWAFFATEFGGRICEFFSVLSMFLMVKRKKSEKEESSASKEHKSIQRSVSSEILTEKAQQS